MKNYKKIPMRKCVVSHEILPKKELIRIIKNKDGKIFVDHSNKANGKGAYIQPKIALVNEAKKTKALEKALQTKISDEIYQAIISEIENYWD
uniref:YlxR family protein n=2 Tax=Spiroplasma platyhelix TaxID=301585 RepID=A0A846U440_9MOLU|nr:YlxR family protein [Spiroplasma platyhelix PALS-1]